MERTGDDRSGSESLGNQEQDREDEEKERKGNKRWKERLRQGEGEGECGQEEIKHRVRYPSAPGLEFDQLRGSGVKGRRPLGLRAPWSVRSQVHTGDGIIR